MGVQDSFEAETQSLYPYLPSNLFIYGVNISLQYKYIFVETPKCACSTIKLSLQRLELDNPNLVFKEFEEIHWREYSPLLNPKQVGSFARLLNDGRYFKFCFVRHPFTRLLSAYLDKIRRNRIQKEDILRQLGLPLSALNKDISFADFVKAVVEQPISMMNPHWRIQYYQTMQTGIHYDFIGRFEQFAEDFRAIGKKLSPDFEKYFVVDQRDATDAAAAINEYLTDELKGLIYQKYKRDFDHFGYDVF